MLFPSRNEWDGQWFQRPREGTTGGVPIPSLRAQVRRLTAKPKSSDVGNSAAIMGAARRSLLFTGQGAVRLKAAVESGLAGERDSRLSPVSICPC